MQHLRTSVIRWVAVWFILPGYLFLLSADRRLDGSFACWLNLTMTSHMGTQGVFGLNDAMKSADSVAGALKKASIWASQSQDEAKTANPDALFNLLIGEWKQYRQVNNSATTTSGQPELRDSVQRAYSPGIVFAGRGENNPLTAPETSTDGVPRADQPHLDQYEPMASGMAMGAP